jgi:TonB family protein
MENKVNGKYKQMNFVFQNQTKHKITKIYMIMQTYYTQLKQWTVLLLLVSFLPTVYAQTPTKITGASKTDTSKTRCTEDDAVYVLVEQKPEFPGGRKGLSAYLQQNIRYPQATDTTTPTKITLSVSFIVEPDGNVTNVRVKNGQPDLDKEIIRVIQTMPPWIPAQHNGKSVRFRYVMSVRFDITSDSDNKPLILVSVL